jgi:hypothetical protein
MLAKFDVTSGRHSARRIRIRWQSVNSKFWDQSMPSFSQHCAALGCPLHSVRNSWAAISKDGRRAVFTIWSDEFDGREYVLHPVIDRRPTATHREVDTRFGAKEMAEIGRIVAKDPSIEALGILCVVEDKNALVRSRKDFDHRSAFVLAVRLDDERVIAQAVGRVDVAPLLKTASGP